jgi:hypothetical protein
MSRHSFGGDISAVVVSAGGGNAAILAGGVTCTFYSAASGGTAYTDLSGDSGGTSPVTSISSSDGSGGRLPGSLPVFYGPNGVTSMWVQAGAAARVLILANDGGGGVSTAGGDTISIPAGGNATGLTIAQGDTTNNPPALVLTNTGTANTLRITPTGSASNSTSAGGAVLVNNTGNAGAGLVVYSNNAAPTGHLVAARADNAAFSQACFYGTSAGTGHTASFQKTGAAASAAALSAVSTNNLFSCLSITGQERGHGTVKISHNRPDDDSDDTNAAALSLDLKKNGKATTIAQGIYMTSSDNGLSNTGTFRGLWFNIQRTDWEDTRVLFRMGYAGEFRYGNLAALPTGHTNFVDLAAYGDRLNAVDSTGYTTELVRTANLPSDYGLLAWNYPIDMSFGAAGTSTAGVMQLIKVMIPRKMTISNVHLLLGNIPVGLTGVYACLYGPTGTLLAGTQSANVASDWNATSAAGTGKTIALGATATVNAGPIFVGFWHYGASTAPTLTRGLGTVGLSNAFLNSTVSSPQAYKYATGASSLTTLASASIATFNPGTFAFWAGLS